MKRRNLFIVILAVICAVSLVLVACNKHEHEFKTSWSYNETDHWHDAKCEHKDEVSDFGPHQMGDNNKCTVCGFEGEGLSWGDEEPGDDPGFSSSQEKVLPAVPEGKAATPSVQLHYYRVKEADYKTWGFWIWSRLANGENGNVDSGKTDATLNGWALNYQDDEGAVALYSLADLGWVEGQDVELGFIAKKMDASWTKDTIDADRFWDLDNAEIDENNYYHLYVITGVAQTFSNKEDFRAAVQQLAYGVTAEFTSETRIEVSTASPIKHIEIYEGTKELVNTNVPKKKSFAYTFKTGETVDLSKDYTVKVVFSADGTKKECGVSITKMYNTDSFASQYNYDGELGAIYTQDKTEFKVWSPVSSQIVLNLYEKGNGGSAYKQLEMTKGSKGVFSATVKGDLGGKYYTYTVYNASYPQGQEIVDPYAKSAGLNGIRGQIVNFAETNPTGWDSVTPKAYDANELTVWETHVADVTSSSTWNGTSAYSKKFLGMIEAGTTYSNGTTTVKTGFDHIKELGVNAVQLVPIFDQAGSDEANKKFNWGYNPLNYNVLEGGYATDATDGYVRIREFKQLVQAFNGANINIIMDVVYNHVSSATGSNFDVLMPGYYFRYTDEGKLSNGSGCGNETASERYMFRKFMIDSVCFWAKEYKLGGFRFDLMGLHDLDTMEQLAAALKKINPSIVVYGEPWTGGSTTLNSSKQATQANANKYVGYGQFNDQMRDALIAGGMNSATSKAWATGGTSGMDNIINGLKGYTGSSMTDLYKTVNYVTCHDNYTLYDRIVASGTTDEATIRKMAMLANSVVFTSNGVNFMLAGEEFLRTKGGDHNSYESSYEVNELNYALKIENADIFANYQKLIEFKQKFVKEFGLTSNDAVTAKYQVNKLSAGAVEITITASGKTWKIVHANAATTVDFSGYTLFLNTGSNVTLSASTAIAPYQTIIASK